MPSATAGSSEPGMIRIRGLDIPSAPSTEPPRSPSATFLRKTRETTPSIVEEVTSILRSAISTSSALKGDVPLIQTPPKAVGNGVMAIARTNARVIEEAP